MWRVIGLETTDAFMAMALDEACAEHASEGGPPTIRLWKWLPSAVSIGYFQGLIDEVNTEKCKELGIDFVRRRTGGGAVYHDSKGEITYSVIAKEGLFPKGITESYREICGWVIKGLENLGIAAEFKPINDITFNGKKISGNAQTRRNGVLHQHGTILYSLDVETMFSVLKVSEAKISDKMIKSVKERVGCILDYNNCTQEETCRALLKGLTDGKEWAYGKWTVKELKRAEQLAREKYSSTEWNFQR